ncbi:hypothetical protein Tco_0078658 [Tanacetum coccineum]
METKGTKSANCQLDEQWFDLSADLLRKALASTPVNPAHPFELPPSGDTVIDLVNELGYPEPVEIVSRKTSGSDKPRYPVLQMLWGMSLKLRLISRAVMGRVYSSNNYYLQEITTSIRHHDSAVHHTGDDYVLEKSQVLSLKENPRERAACKPATMRATPKSRPTTTPVSNKQSQLLLLQRNLPSREGEGDDADLERAIKLSLDPAFLPHGRAPVGGVTIRDPVSEATPKLHEVVGKGKAVVTEEQVAHSLIDLSKKKRTTDQFILIRRDQTPPDSTTGPSSQPEDYTSEKEIHESSSTSDSERTESDTETAAPKDDKDQGEVDSSTVSSGVSIPVSDPVKAHEALAGPDPEPMKEDQTGSDSGKLHVSLAGPNPEHMDDEFLATAYPKVHENLKLITDERVIDDKQSPSSKAVIAIHSHHQHDSYKQSTTYLPETLHFYRLQLKWQDWSKRCLKDEDYLIEKYLCYLAPVSVKNHESEKSQRGLSTPPPKGNKWWRYKIQLTPSEALIEDERRLDKEVTDKVKGPQREGLISDDDEDNDDDDGALRLDQPGRSTKKRRSDSAASGSANTPPYVDA